MISCAIYGCGNNSENNTDANIQYFYFPKVQEIAQHWVNSCWRNDEIDLDTARMCSIHFDHDAYTTEYKIADYGGGYAKLLKYDAVPTLYLNPNVKELTQDNIYVVEDEPNFIYSEAIPSGSQNIIITEENADNLINFEVLDEKYATITTQKKLDNVKENNKYLETKTDELHQYLIKLKEEYEMKLAASKSLHTELRQSRLFLSQLKKSTMSIADQKKILSKTFSDSQIQILMGKKKLCYWSDDDMSVGYTIRHISSKRFYLHLTKHLRVPLPAMSSIKRWAYYSKKLFGKEAKDEKWDEEVEEGAEKDEDFNDGLNEDSD